MPPPPGHARNVATLLSCRRCRVEAATPLLLPLPRVRHGGWKVVSITSRESTPSWLAFSCRLPGGLSRASYCAASAAAAAATAVLPLPAARARLKSPLRARHRCLCHTGVRNVAAAATARSSGRARAGRVSDLSTASQLRRVWPRQRGGRPRRRAPCRRRGATAIRTPFFTAAAAVSATTLSTACPGPRGDAATRPSPPPSTPCSSPRPLRRAGPCSGDKLCHTRASCYKRGGSLSPRGEGNCRPDWKFRAVARVVIT